MVYQCPECRCRTVSWDARCECFLCHQISCGSSFPAVEVSGFSREEMLRRIDLNLLDPELVQAWLNATANGQLSGMSELEPC